MRIARWVSLSALSCALSACDAYWLAEARVTDPHGAPLAQARATFLCPSDLSPTGWATVPMSADAEGRVKRGEMHRLDPACKLRLESAGFVTREVPIASLCQHLATDRDRCATLPAIVLDPAHEP